MSDKTTENHIKEPAVKEPAAAPERHKEEPERHIEEPERNIEEPERHIEAFETQKPIRKKRVLTQKQKDALARGRETSKLNRQKKAQIKKIKKEAALKADDHLIEHERERKQVYKEQIKRELEEERQHELRKQLNAQQEIEDKKKLREREKQELRAELKQEMELDKALRLQKQIDPPPPKPRPVIEAERPAEPPPVVYTTRKQLFHW